MTSWASIAASNIEQSKSEKQDQIPNIGRIAIVDATALIKGFPLDNNYEAVYTVKDVFLEVRDKSARLRLQNLPNKVQKMEPNSESIKTIVNFARGTGDFEFLSTADIKLLALAFEFEDRVHGTQHLSLNPKRVKSSNSRVAGKKDELPGWGTTSNPKAWEVIDSLDESQLEKLENQNPQKNQNLDKTQQVHPSPDDDWIEVSKKTKFVKNKKLQKFEDDEEAENRFESRICCLTGDFGIQNVLLQIGLKLVTPDGIRIQHLTQWGLKCASCFHITKKLGKVFCPNCGNSTLFKVRIEVDENGIEVFGGLTKPQQRRGAKTSIPPPKGGRNNKDAIVSEDVMHQTMSRFRNLKTTTTPDISTPEFDEETWFKTRTIKNQIKDQLPGRFGYPRFMSKSTRNRRKH